MSRKPAADSERTFAETARFNNVKFVQGDCLEPDKYPAELEHCDSVIHCVGALTDSFDYKKLLRMSPC